MRDADLDAVAAQWDHGRAPAVLDRTRLSWRRPYFSIFESPLRRRLDLLAPTDAALDVGCGPGRDLVHLVASGRAARGVGIDPSTGAIAGARRVASSRSIPEETIELRAGTIDDVAPEPVFGLAICISVMNYVVDLEAMLASIAIRLRPDATLLVCDHQRAPGATLARLRSLRRRWRGEHAPTFLTVHHHTEVIDAARAVGFRLERLDFAGFTANRLLNDVLWQLWRRRWPHPATRVLVRAAYRVAAAVVDVEDRARRTSPTGRYYYAVLRREPARG